MNRRALLWVTLLLVLSGFVDCQPPATEDKQQQEPVYSIDSLFYEQSRLARCKVERSAKINEQGMLLPHQPSFPVIAYFTEMLEANATAFQHRANTMVLTIIRSGYFTNLELHVSLAGLDLVHHNWRGKGEAIAVYRSNIFSSHSSPVPITYLVEQSSIELQLPHEHLTIDLRHESATYHYSIVRLVLVLAIGLLLFATTKEFERIGLIASQISTLSLSMLFVKITLELVLVCIDNFAFNKPMESQYIDIFVMIMEFLVVAYANLLLFPTCGTFLRWRLLLWLAFVIVLELLFIGKPWFNLLGCILIMIPQMRINAGESGSLKSGDKVMILLYLYHYTSVLGFTLFEDNYLYFSCSPKLFGVMTTIVIFEVKGLLSLELCNRLPTCSKILNMSLQNGIASPERGVSREGIGSAT